jgi:hypothetical protein
MYISQRGLIIRNGGAAVVNGAITLVLLLIAPLGLAAVITNTFLVTVSTFFVCTAADKVTVWLLPASSRKQAMNQLGQVRTKGELEEGKEP